MSVFDRFMGVHRSNRFMGVFDRFMGVFDRFMIEKAHKTLGKGERPGTMNGQEHPGKIESERSNALERIVENGHGKFTVRSRSRSKNERNTVTICEIEPGTVNLSFLTENVTVTFSERS
jgi:hypothetical protein